MGISAPLGVAASGLPPKGDQANAVVTGTIAAVKGHRIFAFRGPMNFALWAGYNTALTTTANSLAASVGTAGAIAQGNAINSVNVPPGTTVAAISGANVTLGLPSVTLYADQLSTGIAQITLPPGSNVAKLVGATVTVASDAEGITLAANTTVIGVIQADAAPSPNGSGQVGIVQLSAAPTVVPAVAGPKPLIFALGSAAITVSGADANATFTGTTTQTDAPDITPASSGDLIILAAGWGSGASTAFSKTRPLNGCSRIRAPSLICFPK